MIDVQRCPIPQTKAPSRAPKYNATKNPGKESKATVWIGLGGCMNDPTTHRAENMESIATRDIFDVLKMPLALDFFVKET